MALQIPKSTIAHVVYFRITTPVAAFASIGVALVISSFSSLAFFSDIMLVKAPESIVTIMHSLSTAATILNIGPSIFLSCLISVFSLIKFSGYVVPIVSQYLVLCSHFSFISLLGLFRFSVLATGRSSSFWSFFPGLIWSLFFSIPWGIFGVGLSFCIVCTFSFVYASVYVFLICVFASCDSVCGLSLLFSFMSFHLCLFRSAGFSSISPHWMFGCSLPLLFVISYFSMMSPKIGFSLFCIFVLFMGIGLHLRLLFLTLVYLVYLFSYRASFLISLCISSLLLYFSSMSLILVIGSRHS